MGMDAHQIATAINSGSGPEGLFNEGSEIKDLADRHNRVIGRIKALQDRMEQSWQGEGADAARAGAGPLVDASKVAKEHMDKAGTLYEGQGDSFNKVKSSVGEGPGPKPDIQKSTSVGHGGVPQVTNGAALEKWHEEAEQVVDAYKKYQTESRSSSTQWPDDYGKLGLPEGGKDFKVDMPTGSTGPGKGVEYVSSPGPGSSGGPYQHGGPGGSPTYPGSPGSGPGSAGDVSPGPGTGPARGETDTPADVPAASDTSTGTAGHTTPGNAPGGMPGHSGYSAGYGPGPGSGAGQHIGPGGNSGSTYGYGAAPGYGSASGSGSSGSFGPRGSGGASTYGAPGSGSGYSGRGGSGIPGSGGAGSGNAAPGRSSGIGSTPREAAPAPARGTTGATGSSGSAGGRGMVPGMGGAGRGQGGDDETHERATYLEEPDSEGLFGPDPDDKTVPP